MNDTYDALKEAVRVANTLYDRLRRTRRLSSLRASVTTSGLVGLLFARYATPPLTDAEFLVGVAFVAIAIALYFAK